MVPPHKKPTVGRDLHSALPERAFQTQVLQLAEKAGWFGWHDNDSRRNKRGWPDLVLVRPPRIIFAELKAEKGRVRPEQAVVLEMLGRVPGIETYLWRPSMWDEIVSILTLREAAPRD